MGPHSFKCGKFLRKGVILIGVMSFNGAALFQVRKGWQKPCDEDEPLPASMGPHSFKCGKIAYWWHPNEENLGFNGAALFQVRKVNYALYLLDKAGYRFNGAALFQVRKVDRWRASTPANKMLQWGRTLSSAESSGVHPRRGVIRIGFNGAALFQVRKAVFRPDFL